VKINCCVSFGLWSFKWTLLTYLGFAVHCLWLHNWRLSPFDTYVERMWFDNVFQSTFHVSLGKISYMKINMVVEAIHNVQHWGSWFSHWGLFKFPFCLKNLKWRTQLIFKRDNCGKNMTFPYFLSCRCRY